MKLKVNFFLAFIILSGIQPDQSLAVKHMVHVRNFYFFPHSLNVNVGDTIRWLWDNGSHITTYASLPAGAQTWDSPINGASQVYAYKAVVSGVHNYIGYGQSGRCSSYTLRYTFQSAGKCSGWNTHVLSTLPAGTFMAWVQTSSVKPNIRKFNLVR